ncbi:MAG: hypothetical protein RMJ04_15370, partial [Geminicoccaceae bacterium]|nr:hypothetical protein [Geminicoccaceae bacterium]
ETGTGAETAPRRRPGTSFTLELRGPGERLEELRNVVRAWILFGGYGSRTRRGLGSLGVGGGARAEWLPQAATREALSALFGRDVFAPASRAASETPRLAGATLLVGRTLSQKELGIIQTPPLSGAELAWLTALHWLRDFRQSPNEGARRKKTIVDPKSNKTKQLPGVSNWPEADVIRRLVRDEWTHEPRAEHRGTVRWPRAEFGLPIGFQFLGEGPRDDETKKPVRFDLVWKDPSARDDEERERLASPLIVKAMPLADGKFVPIALWLDRAFPKGGVVVLRMGGEKVQGSEAPFDKLLGRGDTTLFKPLAGKTSLRDAFLDWLVDTGRARRIAG